MLRKVRRKSHKVRVRRRNAEVSVQKWKEAVESADSKKRLTLLYLANDVLQNARKKGDEFAKAFSNILSDSVPLMYKYIIILRIVFSNVKFNQIINIIVMI